MQCLHASSSHAATAAYSNKRGVLKRCFICRRDVVGVAVHIFSPCVKDAKEWEVANVLKDAVLLQMAKQRWMPIW